MPPRSSMCFWAFYFDSVALRTAHNTALPQHAAGKATAPTQQRTQSTAIRSKRPTKVQPASRCRMNSQLSLYNSSNVGGVEGHPVTQPTASRSNWKLSPTILPASPVAW